MSVYQINYDLRNKRNYQVLYDKLESYRTWCKPLESCYLICSDLDVFPILNDLKSAIDKDDGILIAKLTGTAGWEGLSDEVSQWIKHHLPKHC